VRCSSCRVELSSHSLDQFARSRPEAYDKGASVLRQLAAWVGDDGFRRGLVS
jgi:hypothetical protein